LISLFRRRLGLSQAGYFVLSSALGLLLGLAVFGTADALSQEQKTGSNRPIEIHDRIAPGSGPKNAVALTLDACSGAFDEDLLAFLIRNRIPATLFVTKKWMTKNAGALDLIKHHLDLFEVEDHGENHIPAVIGRGRKVYGIPGEPDLLHLRQEVLEGARAIQGLTGVSPRWYRGATAEYDQQAVAEIRRLGFGIAGFSVNVDAGGTLRRQQIVERLRHVQAGDVLIAHMNKPRSDSAEGLATGLMELLRRGLAFVRLDQVQLVQVK
jgi:peptidoglycan/xylan/chitin deacetylase (PgdA/CDA1 family)